MAKNLFKISKQKKIKYFLISFVDLFGVLRSKLVPAHAIKDMPVSYTHLTLPTTLDV